MARSDDRRFHQMKDAFYRLKLTHERIHAGFCIILLFCASLVAFFIFLISYGTEMSPTTMAPQSMFPFDTLVIQSNVGSDENQQDESFVPMPVPRPASKRPLRIAQIAPLEESVPPRLYGGTERVVYNLIEELVKRGHHVVLFASADSQTSAVEQVSHEQWSALFRKPAPNKAIPYAWMLDQVRRRADEFDILHFHTMEHFNIIQPFVNRTLTTLHGELTFPDLVPMFTSFNNVPLISISNDQRTHLNIRPNFVSTVYHGMPKNILPFTAKPRGNYLAFLGRTSKAKGPEWAIQIAVKAGIPLKMAAKVDPEQLDHWENVVKPLVEKHSDLVEYIGEINDTQKGDFLGNALAFLFPIDWPEPFGLVMIEAMACGTPVVARDRGSVREIVEHGVSGLIFETMDEGVAAVRRVGRLSRQRVRKSFERRFTSEKMADNYLRVYEQIAQQNSDFVPARRK